MMLMVVWAGRMAGRYEGCTRDGGSAAHCLCFACACLMTAGRADAKLSVVWPSHFASHLPSCALVQETAVDVARRHNQARQRLKR